MKQFWAMYNKKSGNIFGSLTTHDGKSFAIEKCHHGHVWKEFDVSSFKEDIRIHRVPEKTFQFVFGQYLHQISTKFKK